MLKWMLCQGGGCDEFLYCLHNRRLLLSGQLRVDGQGQSLLSRKLARGELAFPIVQSRKAFLQMQRDGVVDFSAYALLRQKALQLVAGYAADDELVIDVPPLRGFDRKPHAALFK